ncbi:MAG: GNAT family N-acetyltransferase [Gammaproteobacteria bacterium]
MKQVVDIDLARLSDAQTIAAMSRDYIESGLGWSWGPNRVTRSIRCPDTVVLVARARRLLAGFAVMYFGMEEARLNLLAVHPGLRQLGIGRRLIEWLERSALTAGISTVYLEVRVTNRNAQAFYRRLGYRKVQLVPGYYSGVEAAVRMGRDLWASTTRSAI